MRRFLGKLLHAKQATFLGPGMLADWKPRKEELPLNVAMDNVTANKAAFTSEQTRRVQAKLDFPEHTDGSTEPAGIMEAVNRNSVTSLSVVV